MKRFLAFIAFWALFFPWAMAQQKTDFAIELAAFDQSVPLSYFKGIKGVYETYDINQIYRYHIAADSKIDAEAILQEVQQAGFPNARIIDFEYIREICESRCGYIPPQPTGIGMNPNTSNNNTVVQNTTTNNNPSSNSRNTNNTPTNTTTSRSFPNTNNSSNSMSIDATALLGEHAEEIPAELLDPEFQEFMEKNADLGMTEEELAAIYKKHGNIKIDQADWFVFKSKNADVDASDDELVDFYLKHGNIKISRADWFVFKTKKEEDFDEWQAFKEKNKELDATDEELLALYEKHGNIRISNAIWFAFQEDRSEYPDIALDDFSGNANVQTVGFVMFEFGGTRISPNTLTELQKVASALSKNENLSIDLIGHADAIGNAYANKLLSLRRANTVKQFLARKGIEADRMKALGKGEDDPIAINNLPDGTDSPQGRQFNRRVDLLVVDPQGNPVNIVSSIQIPQNLRYNK